LQDGLHLQHLGLALGVLVPAFAVLQTFRGTNHPRYASVAD
jgi:hypothetical protein